MTRIAIFFALMSLHYTKSCFAVEFGYITYSSCNIGDDIQSLAAQRFLPEKNIAINREFIGNFKHTAPVFTIMNGWYMHTKDFAWYMKRRSPPEKSWPPPPSIHPLLISIHFTEGFIPCVITDESIAYLKQHAPIGARDYSTLKLLQTHAVPSYFSGCLTLTLENAEKDRDDIVYVVDLDDECVAYVKSKTKSKVIVLTHNVGEKLRNNKAHRLNQAQSILDKYKRAKCVVTCRLHATMPCLAFETPVLLIGGQKDLRFDGLRDLVRHCSKADLLSGNYAFNFDAPTANPDAYKILRNLMVEHVSAWVKNVPSKAANN